MQSLKNGLNWIRRLCGERDTETATVTETETEMQEFSKSETQYTTVTSNESLSVTDTANMSKQEKEADQLSEQERKVLQPNVTKYDCSPQEKSPKDKPFCYNITVRPFSPNLTITVINHEVEDKGQGLQMGTHEVDSVSHGPKINKRCTEREFFKPLLEQLPQMGEIWYLISSGWMKKWKSYVGYDCCSHNYIPQDERPEPLQTQSMIDPMTSKLYTGLKRGKNYELVPQEAWIKFVDMYSLYDKSEPIERKVIEVNGANGKECEVDVYPLEVLVACYSPEQEELKEFSFPSNIEIAELATTLLEKYEVSHGRLWIRLKHGSHKPLQESAGTCQLRKYNVHQPCTMILESCKDGIWPTTGIREYPTSDSTSEFFCRTCNSTTSAPAKNDQEMETDTEFEFNTQRDTEDLRESAQSMEFAEDTCSESSGGGGNANMENVLEQEKKISGCCVHSSPKAGQTHTKKCKLNPEFHCGEASSTNSIHEADDGRRRKQKATNVVGTVPVMDEQRKEKEFFKPQLEQSPNKGETWYLISSGWMKKWKSYVGYDCPSHNYIPQEERPEPLQTQSMIDPKTKKLCMGLKQSYNYEVVPNEAWNKFVELYGLSDNSDPIERKVIEVNGANGKECEVDVYPLEVLVALYSPEQEELKEFSFPSNTEIAELARTLLDTYNVSNGRLWIRLMYGSHKLLQKSAGTRQLMAQNVHLPYVHKNEIMILESCENGVWAATGRKEFPIIEPTFFSRFSRNKITPGKCGLQNLGNTCYMNSALQCLSNTRPLREYFIQDIRLKWLNVDNPRGMRGEMAKSFGDLLSDMWSGNFGCLSPALFKRRVGQFAEQFSDHQQQDAQELLIFVLDGLHEDLNRGERRRDRRDVVSLTAEDMELADMAWQRHWQRNQSKIVEMYHGLLKVTFECQKCKQVDRVFDPFSSLALQLPQPVPDSVIKATVIMPDPNSDRVKHIMKFPKSGKAKYLKEKLSEELKMCESQIFVVRIKNHEIQHLYRNHEQLPAEVHVYILDHPENDPNLMHLVINHIVVSYTGSLIPFGDPFIISLPRDAKCDEVYHAIKNRCPLTKVQDGEEQYLFGLGVVQTDKTTQEKYLDIYDDSIHDQAWRFVHCTWEKDMKAQYYCSESKTIHHRKHFDTANYFYTLHDCMGLFTAPNYYAHKEWYCPNCEVPVEAVRKCTLWKLPEILIIHLKRFTSAWNKLTNLVDYPIRSFDMRSYVATHGPEINYKYDLFAVCNHKGGMSSGHYTAYCKRTEENGEEKWYNFDDLRISEIKEKDVVTPDAYILFYIRTQC